MRVILDGLLRSLAGNRARYIRDTSVAFVLVVFSRQAEFLGSLAELADDIASGYLKVYLSGDEYTGMRFGIMMNTCVRIGVGHGFDLVS
ncbi:MAG: hypothetical protein GY772_19430, partial [bacterium]|nr:hypothetical protein [bacterium]